MYKVELTKTRKELLTEVKDEMDRFALELELGDKLAKKILARRTRAKNAIKTSKAYRQSKDKEDYYMDIIVKMERYVNKDFIPSSVWKGKMRKTLRKLAK